MFSSLGDQSPISVIASKNILVFVMVYRDTYTYVIPGAHKIAHFLLLTDSTASAPIHLAKFIHPFTLTWDTMINKVSDCVFKIILSIRFISTCKGIVVIQELLLSLTCKVF